MDEDVQDPFGYANPPRSPDHQFTVCPGGATQDNSFGTPPPYSPESAEGTPKVPLVPFAGAPDKSCPGAPKKGKAPSNYYDHVSGEAPVRRLSFRASSSDGDVSPEPAGDSAADSMDEDELVDQAVQQQPWQQAQQQWPQQQGTPAATPGQLNIPQQPNQDQLLLSPSPPPVQQLFQQHQQLFSQQLSQQQQHQQQQQQQQQRTAHVQQQLFAPPPHNSGCQLRPQQLWPSQAAQPASQQMWPSQQAAQQQQHWPMSPAQRPRPAATQGSTTPARLFR